MLYKGCEIDVMSNWYSQSNMATYRMITDVVQTVRVVVKNGIVTETDHKTVTSKTTRRFPEHVNIYAVAANDNDDDRNNGTTRDVGRPADGQLAAAATNPGTTEGPSAVDNGRPDAVRARRRRHCHHVPKCVDPKAGQGLCLKERATRDIRYLSIF